jgi:hypothetical protein
MRRWLVLLLALISLIVGVRTFGLASKPEGTIDIESVQVARDLLSNIRTEIPLPGTTAHDRPPGLAMILTLAALVDGRVELGLSCTLADRAGCRPDLFSSVIVAQYFAAVAIFVMMLVMAWRLSRAWDITLIALVLTFIAVRPADTAGLVRPMIWYQFLLALYLLLALFAHQKRSGAFAFAAGAALGLSALFEPLTAFVIPIAALLCFLPSSSRREQVSRPALQATAILTGAATSIGLLAIAISLSYDLNGIVRHVSRHLAERAAFNGMDLGTWVAALIVPIPLVGDWLQALFSDAAQKVGGARAGSIASDGMIRLFEAGMAKGGSPTGAVFWLVREQMAGQIGPYLWSLPPMVSRGIWAGGGVVALFGLFHVYRALRLRARRETACRPARYRAADRRPVHRQYAADRQCSLAQSDAAVRLLLCHRLCGFGYLTRRAIGSL